MNAEKARKISLENANQIAEDQLKEAIEEMDKKVKISASAGLYEANISVFRSAPWEEHSNSRRLKDHFQKLGYGVEIVDYPGSITIRTFW